MKLVTVCLFVVLNMSAVAQAEDVMSDQEVLSSSEENIMDSYNPKSLEENLEENLVESWLLSQSVVSSTAQELPLFEHIGGNKVLVKVSKSQQKMRVYVNGYHYATWKVSTGRVPRYRTPTGSWRPTRMHSRYTSKKYGGKMPYAIFYYRGYAVHGTSQISRLGRRASHGCVRLHPSNARTLFRLVLKYKRANTRIIVRW